MTIASSWCYHMEQKQSNAKEMYTVVIVDDHLLFSKALGDLVSKFDDFEVLYFSKNGKECIDKISSSPQHPDIILMDINMPVMNGIEATQYISDHFPAIKVIGLSMNDDESHIIQMLRVGARGYLVKDISPVILERALSEVATRGFYYSEIVTNSLVSSIQEKDDPGKMDFKENELTFIKLACTQKTYKEIAAEMFLSPKTIDGYRESLFHRLGIKSRVGLVLYAIKHGIFEV